MSFHRGLLAALLLASGAAQAAELSVLLVGTAQDGAPLEATVGVEVLAADEALLHVTNVSGPSPGVVVSAPIDRVGFNLKGGPPASCLTVEEPAGWTVGPSTTAWCGAGDLVSGPVTTTGFMVQLDGSGAGGIPAGEVRDIRLRLAPACLVGYAMTVDSFARANPAPAAGSLAQWAVTYGDHGCARGRWEGDPKDCRPLYTWSEFIATAATVDASPSVYSPYDRRAGSVELNFNGRSGMNGVTTDRPYDAAILSVRNGASTLLEQHQVNRVWAGGDGCADKGWFWRCWLFAPDDLTGDSLSAWAPVYSVSSNAMFDDTGTRVEVSGHLHLSYAGGDTPTDNAHEHFVVTWFAPQGMDTAQLHLRGRFDRDLDGLDEHDDAMMELFRRNLVGWSDFQAPPVAVLVDNDHEVTIAVNVQWGLERVCGAYRAVGQKTPLPKKPATVTK